MFPILFSLLSGKEAFIHAGVETAVRYSLVRNLLITYEKTSERGGATGTVVSQKSAHAAMSLRRFSSASPRL